MIRRAFPLLCALALLAGCAINPVTGERELMLVSEAQEQQLGRDADQQIVAQYGVVADPNLERYVSELGQRLAGVSHVKDWSFTFRLLDDPVVNAFALPGGYVYVTRGILAHLDSEAALAGVMGHEVGHVAARHGAQRMTRQTLFGLTFGLAGSLLGERVGSLLGLATVPAQLLMLKYGRDDERQSDQLGVQYASALGYDTTDMATFFKTLGAISYLAGGRLPSWASTHPDPGERHETVLRLTQQAQAAQPGDYARERGPFLQRLEGLVYGPDPRQGLVRNGAFHHPQLRFSFPVPQGWQVQNTATQVALAPESGEAAVIFTLADGASAAAAADAFGSGQGVTVSRRADLRVDGDPAVRLWTQVQGQQQTVATVSTFVQRDGRVYVFHGLALPQDLPQHEAQLVAVADGFRRLTDPALLKIQPVRLHLITADRSGTFAQLVARWPIPADAGIDLTRLALLNGVQPDDAIAAGAQLKVLTQAQ